MVQFRKRAALVAAAASLGVAILPGAAHATATATFADGTLTVSGDGANDTITLSALGGQLALNGTAVAGANADGSVDIVIDGGEGRDAIDASALASAQYKSLTVHGGAGDDVITGGAGNDRLLGDDGNDRVIGFRGADDLDGGNGNDVLVWNNGDGSDVADGGAGADSVEVNGSQTGNDQFTIRPNGQRVQFNRISLNGAPAGNFGIDLTAETVQVNGLGGDDEAIGSSGLAPLTRLELNGGTGADHLVGGDSADVINGGDDNDSLDGAGGDDRVVGDRGADTMNGGAGDDTLVWNNGDGSDIVNGDSGRDDVEVNGAPAAGDTFAVEPNGARIKFDRTNLVAFTLDIGSSETLHANGLGGNDTITIGEVGSFEVTGSGGPGNDTLTGAGSSETFLGGSGNDTITPGGGIDVVSGGDGDDQVNIRDRTADLALGGAGNDSVVADVGQLDIVDGFEVVDRTPNATPPPVVDRVTQPVIIKGGRVKVKKGIASIKVSSRAGASGNSTGSLTLRTGKAVKLAGLRATLQLGSARYDIAPGTSKTLKVKLAKGSRRLAGRNGRLRALAIASTGPAGNIAQSSQRLTLAFGRATNR